ncbi:MAG: cytochrome P450 [Myxococcota bacterium]
MTDAPRPKIVSGAKPESGHYEEFLAHAAHFLYRAYQECGELAEFDLYGQKHILIASPDAQEAVYRAPDAVLSASAPYQYLVPVFGEGIQYGAPLEIERQQVKIFSNALRPAKMKGYAQVIAQEVEEFIADWGDEGEKDFHDTYKDLVLRTSTHCLMGGDFRRRLTDEFGALFHDLEESISPEAVIDAHSEEEAFKRRDRARAKLQTLLMKAVEERRAGARPEIPDMLETFLEARYADGTPLADELIPGMIVWIMFGGFHTSSNTAAWASVELARHPEYQKEVIAEVDRIYRKGEDLSLASLREMPVLEGFVSETLRLHPPLCTLMRQVMQPFAYKGYDFPIGTNIVISPYVSHRIPEVFPDPERFDPHRPEPDHVFALIPFGGGKRKCVGNSFAFLQVKSILTALLSRYELSLVDPPETYREVMPSLILRPSAPCKLRYTRREKA